MSRSFTFLAITTAVLALAACGTSNHKTASYAGAPSASPTATRTAASGALVVRKNVHVTNTPTKAFRVKAVDTREAVAVGPSGYAVYTFQGETTHHIICQKTSEAKTTAGRSGRRCRSLRPIGSASSRASAGSSERSATAGRSRSR
jgi:hypothetical protein